MEHFALKVTKVTLRSDRKEKRSQPTDFQLKMNWTDSSRVLRNPVSDLDLLRIRTA